MHPYLFEVCMASRILNIVRGDSYPFLDNSYTIRLIDKNTGELTNYDFSNCYAVLQIQHLQIRYDSNVLNTKLLPIELSREQTLQLKVTKSDYGYLAIYRNDGLKKKTKVVTIQFSVQSERVND